MKNTNLVTHVVHSIFLADKLESKLPVEVSEYEVGLSSRKIRHLLNNLCSIEGVRFLNLGLASGSSFWSSIFENEIEATGVDWFKMTTTKGTEIDFWRCLHRVIENEKKTVERKIEIYSTDCYKIDFKSKYNIFFYDVDHSEEGQYKGLIHFDRYMEDEFILLIDDFDQPEVQRGTEKAIRDLNYNLQYSLHLPGIFGDWNVKSDHWWNGLYVAVVKKQNKQ